MARKKLRADGRVEKKITIGKDAEGKPIRKSFYGTNMAEVNRKIDDWKIQNALDDRSEFEKKFDRTFSAVSEEWLELRRASVSYYTHRGYSYKVKAMNEYFGNTPIVAIKKSHIQKYINTLAGQSINTVKKYMTYLKSIFEFAVENEYIARSPYQNIKMPVVKETKERHPYNKKQARYVINVAKEAGRDGLCAFIPLKTGLRPGEVLAFNVKRDIDFRKRLVYVNETVKIEDGRQTTGDPKTQKSIRKVPVDDEFLSHMLQFKDLGYIWDNGNGRPKNYSNWRNRNFKKFMEKLPGKLAELDPHELRTSYGTLLYLSGTDLYTIMEVMGHTKLEVTQIYVIHNTNSVRENLRLDF